MLTTLCDGLDRQLPVGEITVGHGGSSAHVPDTCVKLMGVHFLVPVGTFEITSGFGSLGSSRQKVYYKRRDWINGMPDIEMNDGKVHDAMYSTIEPTCITTAGFTEPRANGIR